MENTHNTTCDEVPELLCRHRVHRLDCCLLQNRPASPAWMRTLETGSRICCCRASHCACVSTRPLPAACADPPDGDRFVCACAPIGNANVIATMSAVRISASPLVRQELPESEGVKRPSRLTSRQVFGHPGWAAAGDERRSRSSACQHHPSIRSWTWQLFASRRSRSC